MVDKVGIFQSSAWWYGTKCFDHIQPPASKPLDGDAISVLVSGFCISRFRQCSSKRSGTLSILLLTDQMLSRPALSALPGWSLWRWSLGYTSPGCWRSCGIGVGMRWLRGIHVIEIVHWHRRLTLQPQPLLCKSKKHCSRVGWVYHGILIHW